MRGTQTPVHGKRLSFTLTAEETEAQAEKDLLRSQN